MDSIFLRRAMSMTLILKSASRAADPREVRIRPEGAVLKGEEAEAERR
jgi:hypothetical protein